MKELSSNLDREQLKSEIALLEICEECLHKLEFDDYKYEYEHHAYGATYATETIIAGYTCKKCGYELTI